MQRKSRDARNMLNLQIVDARSLKNRTGCESISDLVLLYREFQTIEKLEEYKLLLYDSLLNKKQAEDFFTFIKKIVDFEVELVKARNDLNSSQFESKKVDLNKFHNYNEIVVD